MSSDSKLAREVARLRREVEQIKRGQRVAHGASIENAAIEVRDDNGSLRAVVGQQPDGTTGVNVVNGPTPPTPSVPTVEPALAALAVTWDGTFTGAPAAPLDWMRCEVHIGATADFTPDQGTLRDTIESPQGGTVVVPLPYTEWHVKLRSRTTSGVASPPTAAVAGTPRKADAPDIQAGAIVADHIAVDALTGKTITGGVLRTAADGQRVVVLPSNSYNIPAVQFYSGAAEETAPGEVVASVTSGSHPRPYISLWAPTVDSDTTAAASLQLLSGGGDDNDQGEWTLTTGHGSGGITQIYAYASDGGAQPGQLTLSVYEPLDAGAAELSLYHDGFEVLDLNRRGISCYNGVFRAGNVAWGTNTVTPSAAHTPTSLLVTGYKVAGTTFRAYATANTTVPGVRAPAGSAGVTGVGVSSVTSSSFLLWVNRENTTATVVNWMVIGE